MWTVWALPFGKDQYWAKSGIGNAILGGWLINPIISKMSGTPFTVNASGGNLNANGSQQTADLVGQFHLTHGRPPRSGQVCQENDPTCHFFDPTAFAQPQLATYGNTGRNQFRGPGYFNMNLSVSRTFKFTERVSMDIRADAFGLTNTPHFANPNTGCPGSAVGAVCTTGSTKAPSNFGTITSTVSPGGFFGPDPGTRTVWLGATVKF